MRHLSIFCLLLILFPSLCLASQDNETCDVLFLPTDEQSLRVETWNTYYFTLDNVTIPSGFKNAVLFNDLTDGAKFQIRWASVNARAWDLTCNSEKRVFLEVDRYARFNVISEEKAANKLHKFKKLKTLELKGRKYIVAKEQSLDKSIALAEVFSPLKEQSQTNSSQSASMKQEFSTSQPSFTWEKASSVNRNAVAVIIGSKNYAKANKGVPDVDYALNDAKQMYQYVTKSLGYREGNVIYLKDATQADLVSTFGLSGKPKGKLYDWLRPGKSDVFVYYSGHGAPSLSNGQGFFLPVDADPQRVELNGYSLQTFYENLAQLPAKSVTVVMDACFSGSSQSGTVVKNASPISLRLVEAKNVLRSATVLAAADVTEVASWDTSAKHGLFTRYFLEGVSGEADGKDFGNGDGNVTLGELKTYLEDNVTYFARRNFSREQHPQISGNSAAIMSSNGQ